MNNMAFDPMDFMQDICKKNPELCAKLKAEVIADDGGGDGNGQTILEGGGGSITNRDNGLEERGDYDRRIGPPVDADLGGGGGGGGGLLDAGGDGTGTDLGGGGLSWTNLEGPPQGPEDGLGVLLNAEQIEELLVRILASIGGASNNGALPGQTANAGPPGVAVSSGK